MQTACYASVSAGTVNQLETASFETGNMRGRPASDARHCPLPDTGEREQAGEGTAAFAPTRGAAHLRVLPGPPLAATVRRRRTRTNGQGQRLPSSRPAGTAAHVRAWSGPPPAAEKGEHPSSESVRTCHIMCATFSPSGRSPYDKLRRSTRRERPHPPHHDQNVRRAHRLMRARFHRRRLARVQRGQQRRQRFLKRLRPGLAAR